MQCHVWNSLKAILLVCIFGLEGCATSSADWVDKEVAIECSARVFTPWATQWNYLWYGRCENNSSSGDGVLILTGKNKEGTKVLIHALYETRMYEGMLGKEYYHYIPTENNLWDVKSGTTHGGWLAPNSETIVQKNLPRKQLSIQAQHALNMFAKKFPPPNGTLTSAVIPNFEETLQTPLFTNRVEEKNAAINEHYARQRSGEKSTTEQVMETITGAVRGAINQRQQIGNQTQSSDPRMQCIKFCDADRERDVQDCRRNERIDGKDATSCIIHSGEELRQCLRECRN
jgi:hypothetical protein